MRKQIWLLAAALLIARPAFAAPKVSVSPNPVDCGGGPPGNATMPVDVQISNIGDALLNLQQPTVTGPDAGQFALNFNGLVFPISINAGGGILIKVTFTPNAQRNFSATLNVPSNDPNTPNLAVPLVGRGGFPAIAFDTKTLIFGNQRAGIASAPSTFTISNPGAGDLIVSQVTVGGANLNDFAVNPVMFAPIKPGAKAPLAVTFTPGALGGRSATITIVSNGNGGAQQTDTLGLFGSGTQALVACGPGAINFGATRIFSASVPQMATATNPVNMQPDSYTITGISISGPQNAWFTLSPPPKFPIKVAPNTTVSLPLVAIPLLTGPGAASLDIATDNKMTCSIPLSATGVSPNILASPAYVEFGAVPILTTAAPKTLTITNAGGLPLKITDLELGDNVMGANSVVYSLVNAPMPPNLNMPLTIAPGGKLAVDIAFRPTVGMEYDAFLQLQTDDPMSRLLRIPISGAGVMPGFMTNKMAINFGQIPVGQVSPRQTVTLSNTGQSTLNITKISNNNGMFQVSPTQPYVLEPGRSLALDVVFSPVSGGSFTDTLTITIEGQKAAVVALAGTGVAPTLAVSPNALAFDRVQIDLTSSPQTVGLKAGPVPISIDKIVSTDPAYVIDLSGTKLDLAANAQTSFAVTFAPSEARDYPATIKITLKGENTPIQMIGVTGVGKLPRGGCALAGPSREGWPLALFVAAALLALRRRRK